jgi:hypothetical protein
MLIDLLNFLSRIDDNPKSSMYYKAFRKQLILVQKLKIFPYISKTVSCEGITYFKGANI